MSKKTPSDDENSSDQSETAASKVKGSSDRVKRELSREAESAAKRCVIDTPYQLQQQLVQKAKSQVSSALEALEQFRQWQIGVLEPTLRARDSELDIIFRAHWENCHDYLRRRIPDSLSKRECAADLALETMKVVLEKLAAPPDEKHPLRNPGEFWGFLQGVADNKLSEAKRRNFQTKKRTILRETTLDAWALSADSQSEDDGPSIQVEHQEAHEIMLRTIMVENLIHRDINSLGFLGRYSPSMIKWFLKDHHKEDVSVSTIKRHLAQTRLAVATALSRAGFDEAGRVVNNE